MLLRSFFFFFLQQTFTEHLPTPRTTLIPGEAKMTEVIFYRTSAVRPGTIRGPRQGAGRVHPPLPPWFRGGARWAGRQRTASPLVVGRDLVLEVALPRVGTVPPLRLPRLLAEATLVWVGGGGRFWRWSWSSCWRCPAWRPGFAF